MNSAPTSVRPGAGNTTRWSAATRMPTSSPGMWSAWLGKIDSSWLPVGSCRRYRVDAPWNGKIQVGVKNMFNAGPSLESDGFTYDDELYSIDGRIYYLDYAQKF